MFRFRFLFLSLLLLVAGFAGAAEQATSANTDTRAVPPELASPRATMETFLRAMNDIKRGNPDRIEAALSTMDLSGISTLVRTERGRDLAWQLLEILDRTRIIVLKKVPRYTKGGAWVFQTYPEGDIRIEQQADGRWLFGAATIGAIPAILDGLADKKRLKDDASSIQYLPWHLRFRASLPADLRHQVFLLENWQWLGLLLIIAVGIVADKLTSLLLRGIVKGWRAKATARAFQNLPDDLLRPFGLMIMAAIWWAGLNLLGLSTQALLIFLVAVKFLAGLSGVWGAYRLVDLIGAWFCRIAEGTESKLDDALVPLMTRTLKVFVSAIGVIFIADNLNLDVTSLLAGLGLGGLAFALAAKDVVQNLFGSITILIDQTFHVGDWVIIGDIEGTVEAIGFRTTRVRTFYNSLVSIPNSRLITAEVDNMGKRRYRRLSTKLALTYDTPPDRIEGFCEGVRELIRLHPYMRKDYYQVYLNGLGDASLDVLLYVFWETPDWNTELRERHRFLLDILRLAAAMNIEFAFPTQTIHWHEGPPPTARKDSEDDKNQVFQQGRETARQIVEATTGLNVKPPPVVID